MSKRILLFDDDYENMLPFKEFLEKRGYTVELTAQIEILDRLSRQRFDLICVDFMIHPKSPNQTGAVVENVVFEKISWQHTGEEFLRRLRGGLFMGENGQGTQADVPAIVISATANPEQIGQANYVFEKPFDVAEILATIQTLI